MDVHFVQQIDNSRVVRVADPRQRREQQVTMLAVGMLFLLLFGYAFQRFQLVRLGYRAEAARQQAAQLEQWNRGLRLEEASLRDPLRIYTLARRQLGMESAQPGQVLVLDETPAGGTPVMAEARRPAVAAAAEQR